MSQTRARPAGLPGAFDEVEEGAALPLGICGYGLRKKPAPAPETAAAVPAVAEAGAPVFEFPPGFVVWQ